MTNQIVATFELDLPPEIRYVPVATLAAAGDASSPQAVGVAVIERTTGEASTPTTTGTASTVHAEGVADLPGSTG